MRANCGVIYKIFRAALLSTGWILRLRVMAALFPSAIRLRYLRYHWLDKLARWFYPRLFRRRCPRCVGGTYDGGFSNCIFNIYAPLIRRAIMITSRLRPARSACANASAIASRQNKCKRAPITATETSRDRPAPKAPFKT